MRFSEENIDIESDRENSFTESSHVVFTDVWFILL